MIFIILFTLSSCYAKLLPVVDSLLPCDDEQCCPDLPLDLDSAVSIPTDFLTCVDEMCKIKNKTHPDLGKTTNQIITSHGFPCEIYNNVTTQDGYILTVQRIPNKGKIPVYLQHGLGGCSDNWMLAPVEKSLAFLLWNAGYDVWLGNFRGTTYSLGHKTVMWNDPSNFSYWDFSWHEMGKYDVPAVINFISSLTGMSKIFYVGHSMGTSAFMVALDQDPGFINDHVIAAFLLAPAGFMSRSPSPFRLVAPLTLVAEPQYLDPVLKGRIEHPDQMLNLMNTTLGDICTPTATRCTACVLFIYAFFGFDAPQTDYSLIPNLPDRFPNTISVKTLFHYGQSMARCTFRQFDYGAAKNKIIYGTVTPPDYNLKNCRVPIYAYSGNFDNLCRPKDVERTMNLLPKEWLIELSLVDSPYFNHVDFLIAKDSTAAICRHCRLHGKYCRIVMFFFR